jgi:hypothetical protein
MTMMSQPERSQPDGHDQLGTGRHARLSLTLLSGGRDLLQAMCFTKVQATARSSVARHSMAWHGTA